MFRLIYDPELPLGNTETVKKNNKKGIFFTKKKVFQQYFLKNNELEAVE